MHHAPTPPRRQASSAHPATRTLHELVDDALPVTLRDGGLATVRPLGADEPEAVLAVFDGLSPRSRELRFLTGMAALPARMLTVLSGVDGCTHVAWLGLVDGLPAGLARYVRTAHDVAELAFEVVDAHQGRGLGSLLAEAVATVARADGVTRISATVDASNGASIHLLRTLGVALQPAHGLLEGTAPLRLPDPARVDRDAVLALAERDAHARGRTPCHRSTRPAS